MNAWNDLAVDPDDEFASRLEEALVATLHAGPTLIRAQSTQHQPTRQGDMMVITLDEPTHDVTPRRSRWLAVAAAAVLTVGAGALIVSQRDSSAPASAVDVTFEIEWPGLGEHINSRCFDGATTYESADSDKCLRGWTGEATFTGDIEGTALFDMAANTGDEPGPGEEGTNLAGFNATYLVRGSVADCGTGEFMIAEVLRFVGWENGSFVGTWQVIPGSGRDALADISGSGATPTGPLGGGTDTAPRTHTGVIDCG